MQYIFKNPKKTFNGIHFFSLFLFLISISLSAQTIEDGDTFLSGFLSGSYEIVGRMPDSDSIYSGRMTLTPSDSGFNVIRTISGNTISGRAKIEAALRGEQTVLRLRFTKDSSQFEITYLIDSDLDNYPRLSGYIYRMDKSTTKPGIETCFFYTH